MTTTKTINITEIREAIKSKLSNEKTISVIECLPEFVELMSLKMLADVHKASQRQHNLVYLNFWTLTWNMVSETNFTISASCTGNSGPRNLTQRFIHNDMKVTEDLIDYFYNIISKPPVFSTFVAELTSLAKSEGMSKELTIGKNIHLLYRLLFTEILVQCFENKKTVTLNGFGEFAKKLKNKRIAASVGYLQFTPYPQMEVA